jgi:hypothetical protein
MSKRRIIFFAVALVAVILEEMPGKTALTRSPFHEPSVSQQPIAGGTVRSRALQHGLGDTENRGHNRAEALYYKPV